MIQIDKKKAVNSPVGSKQPAGILKNTQTGLVGASSPFPIHGFIWRLSRGLLAFLATFTLFPALCAWCEVKKLWTQAYTGRESPKVEGVAKKVKFNSQVNVNVFSVEKLGKKSVGPTKLKINPMLSGSNPNTAKKT